MSMKNSNDTIGNRSRDLPVCSAVPQPLRHRDKEQLSASKTLVFAQHRQHCEITGAQKRFPTQRDNHFLLKSDLQNKSLNPWFSVLSILAVFL
jgi:hypothetical protein